MDISFLCLDFSSLFSIKMFYFLSGVICGINSSPPRALFTPSGALIISFSVITPLTQRLSTSWEKEKKTKICQKPSLMVNWGKI